MSVRRPLGPLSALDLARESLRTAARAPLFFVLFGGLTELASFAVEFGLVPHSLAANKDLVDLVLSVLLLALSGSAMYGRAAQILEDLPSGSIGPVAVGRLLPVAAVIGLQLIPTFLSELLMLAPDQTAQYLLRFLIALLLLGLGLILLVVTTPAGPICLVEGLAPVASVRRSIAMTRGVRWRIAAATALSLAPSIGFGIGTAIARNAVGDLGPTVPYLQDVFDALSTVFNTVLGSVVYHDLRRREDGSDIAEVFV